MSLIAQEREFHTIPAGPTQPFAWVALGRTR